MVPARVGGVGTPSRGPEKPEKPEKPGKPEKAGQVPRSKDFYQDEVPDVRGVDVVFLGFTG